MKTEQTIHDIMRGLMDNFPKVEEERKYVEDVVHEIKSYIDENKYKIWRKDFPESRTCIAIEIVQDIFNGLELPEGERTFYLLRTPNDQSYFDCYLRKLNINFEQIASKYSFNKSQDRYFEYLMAKEGIIRIISEGELFPSEARWYLL